jgi:GNAT superfamily N-acetyltransferase
LIAPFTLRDLACFRIERVAPEQRDEAAALAALAWDVPPLRTLPGAWRLQNDVLVALERSRGAIIGVTTATRLAPTVARAEETVVARPWRGRGIGVALLDALSTLLRRDGVRTLQGHAPLARSTSLRFLLRYGFRIEQVVRAEGLGGFAEGTRVALTCLDL